MNLFDDVKKQVNNLFKTKNTYSIRGKRYTEEKLIAEGGFGYVYLVTDETGREFAMKKINVQDSSQQQMIKKEISYWSLINKHPNIITLVDYELSSSQALILMEFSRDGNLFNYITNELIEKNKTIKEEQALEIFKQILSGVHHIHSKTSEGKPIQHRDIKIENVLIVNGGFKLCDFGSASTETLDPSKVNKSTIKEQFSKYERTTTFMYRPPEMVDEYSGYPVSEKVDVWMLGCVLFALLYKEHPFANAQRGTIINADYNFPFSGVFSEKIDDFIRLMLTQDPRNRPNTNDLLKIMSNWKSIVKIPLCDETLDIKKKQLETTDRDVYEKVNHSQPFSQDGSGFKPISADELYKAQQSIMQNQKGKKKYKKNDGM